VSAVELSVSNLVTDKTNLQTLVMKH